MILRRVPTPGIRGPISVSRCPFQAVLFPHKTLQQLLLPPPLPPTSATQKDAYSSFFGGVVLGIFCVYKHPYISVCL